MEPRTRPNALFLSVVAQFNGEIAVQIMKWMGRFRNISGLEDANYMAFTAQQMNDKHFGQLIRQLTHGADVGIEDLQAIEIPRAEFEKHLPKNISKALRDSILQSQHASAFTITTYHKKFDDERKACGMVEFNLKTEESAGTQKLIAISGPVLHTLQEGSILFVDELEARFHPLLTKALVGLFHSPANRNGAQLIYATHDQGLLDPTRIRRDQVWFVEKDDIGSSRLFSLAEFKVRKESKFAKEYLLGQFGGVPHVRNLGETLTHGR